MLANFMYAVNVVVPLFLLSVLGYYLAKKKIINEYFCEIGNKLTFSVALPCMLFNNIYKSDLRQAFDLKLLLYFGLASCIFCIITIYACKAVIKDPPKCASVCQGIIRANSQLLGMQFAMNMFPDNYAPASLILPLVIIIANAFGVILFYVILPGEKQSGPARALAITKKVLTNPLIISCYIAMPFSLLSISPPTFIMSTISDIGKLAVPLAMIAIGGTFNFKQMISNLRFSMPVMLLRLVAVPAVLVGGAILVGFRGPTLGAIYVMFSAPTAVTSYTMAKNLGGDAELSGQIVLITTFFSLFTIIAGIFALKTTGLI